MLTQADDFPIHQTAAAVADESPDPNLYERYFFNGYSTTQKAYFGFALGIYPNRGIADATFSVINGNERDSLGFRYDCQTGEDTFMKTASIDVSYKSGTLCKGL